MYFLVDQSYGYSFTPGAEDKSPKSLSKAPVSQVVPPHVLSIERILFIILFFSQLASENTFC